MKAEKMANGVELVRLTSDLILLLEMMAFIVFLSALEPVKLTPV